jgi:hypothetical protein
VFSDLPPGDYVIAALTDMEPSDLLDPSFLETLLPSGVTVRIDEGGRTIQDLRIGREHMGGLKPAPPAAGLAVCSPQPEA